MSGGREPLDSLLAALQERAKELDCLYRVDEILRREGSEPDEVMRGVAAALPRGLQYPEVASARVRLEGRAWATPSFTDSAADRLTAPVMLEGAPLGEVTVGYEEPRPTSEEGPFLRAERRLLDNVAERLALWVLGRRVRASGAVVADRRPADDDRWTVILDLLRRTDRTLLAKLTRRMINHLGWKGLPEAEELLRESAPEIAETGNSSQDNRPLAGHATRNPGELVDRTFQVAAHHLGEDEIVSCLHAWIKEDRASFLYTALENIESSLPEIAALLERFHALEIDAEELPVAARTGLVVALLRRFFSDDLEFLEAGRAVVNVEDFYELSRRAVFPPASHGKLGGKAAGLFVAGRAVARSREYEDVLERVRVPVSWHIASDALLHFVRFNDLEEVYDRKYREIDQIRREYPYLIQVFKGSAFPPELVQGLSAALDDLGETPIIVRSSSLLEDRVGSAFSGKYKSLFLANQGSKSERMAALQDAIAEVYASVFGPDPIEYRAERGLLHVHEEMGIILQPVVGRRVGPYFLPAFSGVAFSSNEIRWSSRIRREDGLARLVPGLGTRAVDRVADDFPVLVAPGQPRLRVNSTPEEIVRYAPRRIDVIRLETGGFETVEVDELLRRHGAEIPEIHRLVSVYDSGVVRKPIGRRLDFARDDLVVTFQGLIEDTPLMTEIRTLLRLLRERMGFPVDLEFASDGEHLYLLQCRAQGHSAETAPAQLPVDPPASRVVFSADRFVTNGRVSNVTHLVYVDGAAYAALPDPRSMHRVGEAVGRLNKILPKRQFVLIGPGRWGSRGDIRLGVPVTYSQIHNTAMLVEVARAQGGYVPDVSFGTHFFQDLVEAGIRYLPLFPDEKTTRFDEAFLAGSPNLLAELLPEFADLADTLRVIDVQEASGGRVIEVLMNGETDRALALLVPPSAHRAASATTPFGDRPLVEPSADDAWRWRLAMAERIAATIDARALGVAALYVCGSTKNATAGPASDLDLLVHFRGDDGQRGKLLLWLDGWSRALAEVNYLHTGHRAERLLDVHVVTDQDLASRTPFAAKIGAVTDPALELPLGGDGRGR